MKKYLQFIKFCFVGVSNNIVYFLTYYAALYINDGYVMANAAAFLTSAVNSFYWNNKYVFAEEGEERDRGGMLKIFGKTFVSYMGTGLILNSLLLYMWVDCAGISALIAPVFNLFITVPINFILNKFWAFKLVNKK